MRGAQKAIGARMAPVRIIQADAGSTASPGPHGHSRGDHPRRCGEHKNSGHAPSDIEGSSPRMRGARDADSGVFSGRRIIPADAGSTARVPASAGGLRDHPRGCGEHSFLVSYPSAYRGSSPRMRGAQLACLRLSLLVGIIPADAGSTCRCPLPV